MNKKFFAVAGLLLAFTVTGCSNLADKRSAQSVVLATPLQVSYQNELKLVRLGQMLSEPDIDRDKLALLFYERGATYDKLGLTSLARFDFNQAIKAKPDFAEAYNYLGVYLTQMQEYDEAFEAFDSVLELAPEYGYAYLNRGIALYYAGQEQLAHEDLTAFYNLDPKDPYRALWLYLVEKKTNPEQALIRLKEHQTKHHGSDWGWQIVSFYTGVLDESAFISGVSNGVKSNKELAERLCEAYFYLAKWQLQEGNPGLASSYFKLALSNNVYEFIEHKYALLELELLLSSSQAMTQ